jgi:hypothetical protein
MLAGGNDACGKRDIPPPITGIKDYLSRHKGSWNHFLGTVGIDDTNWSRVLVGVATLPNTKAHPLPAIACTAFVRAGWNGYKPAIQASIVDGLQKVTAGLRETDPQITLAFQGYYNIAGTGPMPLNCRNAFNGAMDTIHGVIKRGLPADAQFNDISGAMNGQDSLMQEFFSGHLSTQAVRLTGWPHPNQEGAQAIANQIFN